MTPMHGLQRCVPLVCLLTACAEPQAALRCLDLAEVRRYGSVDDTKSDRTAPGVLGDIRGIVSGPNGDVFVLDRSSHLVVAFDSSGEARVIAGRAGEGPGEFRLPMHLASTSRGFSVLDYDLKRITEFDWSGQVARVTTTKLSARPWRHVVRDDTAWVSYNVGGAGEAAFDAVTLADGSVAAGRPFHSDDEPFGPGLGISFTTM